MRAFREEASTNYSSRSITAGSDHTANANNFEEVIEESDPVRLANFKKEHNFSKKAQYSLQEVETIDNHLRTQMSLSSHTDRLGSSSFK